MAIPGMYGRLGKVPRRTKPNRTVHPPTEAGQATLTNDAEIALNDAVTTHDFPVVEGDVGDVGVVLIHLWGGSTGTMTPPAGWIHLVGDGTATTAGGMQVFWRRYTGGETDTTFTTGGSYSAVLAWRFQKPASHDLSDVEASTVAAGGSSRPNSPLITPTTAPGIHWIMSCWVANGSGAMTAPTGYEVIGGSGSAKGFNSQRLDAASRLVDVTTGEDPGEWSDVVTGWEAVTLAIIAKPQLATSDHTHRINNADDVGTGATTKGDILVFDGTDYERLPVGSDGQVLTADSAEALGVKWATP